MTQTKAEARPGINHACVCTDIGGLALTPPDEPHRPRLEVQAALVRPEVVVLGLLN